MLPFCGKRWHPTKTTFSVTGSTETILLQKKKKNGSAFFLKKRGCVFFLNAWKSRRAIVVCKKKKNGDLAKQMKKARSRKQYGVLDWRFLWKPLQANCFARIPGDFFQFFDKCHVFKGNLFFVGRVFCVFPFSENSNNICSFRFRVSNLKFYTYVQRTLVILKNQHRVRAFSNLKFHTYFRRFLTILKNRNRVRAFPNLMFRI